MGSAPLDVLEGDLALMRLWSRSGSTPQRVVRRARIVLLLAEGCSVRKTARRLGTNPRTVMLWRQRFTKGGPDSLWSDAPGRGRPPTIARGLMNKVLELIDAPPPQGGRWTVRSLARAVGVSPASVHRLVPLERLREAVHASSRSTK